MKLSEAIRLGAMVKPKGFGHLRQDGRTCALGAAYECVGLFRQGEDTADITRVVARFPVMGDASDCPECDWHDNLGDIVAHLNDMHRWTREQCADFVASVEQRSGAPRACDAVDEAHESPVAVNARG